MAFIYQIMTRFQLRFLQLFILGVSLLGTARGQSYSDAFLNYKVTAHYPDHNVVAYAKPAERVSLLSDRVYYWFAGNEIHFTQGGYSGKLLNGDYQDYYMNKNLKESGSFDKGLKKGIWKNWTEEGLLKDQVSYKKGKKSGVYLKYDTTGKVSQKGKYNNDLLNGKQLMFIGDSTRIIYYKAGKLTSHQSFFNSLKSIPGSIGHLFSKKDKQQSDQSKLLKQSKQASRDGQQDSQNEPTPSGQLIQLKASEQMKIIKP